MLITFTAYILIPVYTLLFVAGSDWFTTNFSVLGNIAGRNEAFVLWGLMVGIYFFVCLRKIFRRMPEKPAGTWLVPLALVLLDFAVTTPYLPEMFPLKAYLHIVFALCRKSPREPGWCLWPWCSWTLPSPRPICRKCSP